MTLLPRRIPSAMWPAGCAISAYIGARYAAPMAVAAWTVLALLAMIYGLYFALMSRHEYNAVQRDIDRERAALAMGRRAPWVMITVVDKEGNRYARTLGQVLTDPTPEGRDMLWDAPEYAVLYFLDPGWKYEEADRA